MMRDSKSPAMKRNVALLLAAAMFSGCTTVSHSASPRVIHFSGLDWVVKNYSGQVGPGPNYFSDDSRNVWVDSLGRLHLKIEKRKGKWYCGEVVCTQSLGQGTYRFYFDSDVAGLDPNVVLGLFTWSNTPDYNNREIDIEFSRWGDRNGPNAQFVVQPYSFPNNLWTYFLPAGLTQTTHSFTWAPGAVLFRSAVGHQANPPADDVIAEHEIDSPDVPPAADETPRINLWLRQGLQPTNRRGVEVIITAFEFEPL